MTTTAPAATTEVHRQRRFPWFLLAAAVNALLAAAAIFIPLTRLTEAYQVNDWWTYQASEWLINFGGGTVRRGLAGELLRLVPGVDDKTAVTLFTGALMVLVPLVFAVLVQRTITATRSPWALLLWGIPGGLLLGLVQGEWLPLREEFLLFATRKEYLFTLVFLLFALAIARSQWTMRWSLGYGLTLVPLAFVHEGLTFTYALAGALLAVIVRTTRPWWRPALAVLVPAGLAVMATVPFSSPGPDQQLRMWESLDPQTREWIGGGVPGPFELLGFSFGEARQFAAESIDSVGMVGQWAMIGAFVLAWTVLALVLVDMSGTGLRWTVVTAAVMSLAFLPLMVVAIDWGRFFVIAATTTAIIGMARVVSNREPARPAPVTAATVGVAAAMVVSLAMVGVPEAGAPFGDGTGINDAAQ